MAIGSLSKHSGGNQRPTIYTRLGHGENVGFIQSVETRDGRQSVTHQDVSGRVAGFYVKEDVTYEASKDMRARGINPNKVDLSTLSPEQKHFVANLRLRDDNPDEPDVVVQFNLADSLGGKVVGILNAQLRDGKLQRNAAENPVLVFSTFYRVPNTQYNDGHKGKDSINAWPAVLPKGRDSYIRPVFMTADGESVLMDLRPGKEGEIGGLPMGVEVKVGNKRMWDHSERDEVVLSTAVAVTAVYAKQAQEDTDGNSEGVDMGEAAAAAAPSA